MHDLPDSHAGCPAEQAPASQVAACFGILGVAAYGLALWAVQPFQFQVVHYAVEPVGPSGYSPPLILAGLVPATIIALSVWATCASATHRRMTVVAAQLWPLVLSAPLACYVFVDRNPPFVLSLLVILGVGWSAFRVGSRWSPGPSHRGAHPGAVLSITVLIVLLTLVHTRLQINFFEHFMLGHTDFGHFTEELKNALAGRGLRSDSFHNTRLGWHFVPLLYVLVPGYALWPSPVYLMVCSALFVHVAALPVYYLARRLSGSVMVGWMFGVAWLLLPSQSRLVYSNSYGFQWIYFAVPLLAIMISAGVLNRWRTCLVMVVVVLLCKETAAAATLGWGLYVMLFTRRRKTGAWIAVVSVVYFILCVKVLIPHFAAAGRYERLDLFGELGGTFGDLFSAAFTQPDVFWGRLVRWPVLYFLLMLLVPMALLPLRGWRVAIAAVPTLVLVLLLQNDDWLSIKFWHQCTVLPFLFFAGIASMKPDEMKPSEMRPSRGRNLSRRSREPARKSTHRVRGSLPTLAWLGGRRVLAESAAHRGMALAALICAALGHYFYGFSPISKPYEPYAAATFLHQPDPRLAFVRELRAEIPKDRTILASERLAAHFVDYKRIYTGGRIRPADFVIIDRRDGSDTSGLPRNVSQFSDDPDYRVYGEFGSIIVFERHPDAPPVPLD